MSLVDQLQLQGSPQADVKGLVGGRGLGDILHHWTNCEGTAATVLKGTGENNDPLTLTTSAPSSLRLSAWTSKSFCRSPNVYTGSCSSNNSSPHCRKQTREHQWSTYLYDVRVFSYPTTLISLIVIGNEKRESLERKIREFCLPWNSHRQVIQKQTLVTICVNTIIHWPD